MRIVHEYGVDDFLSRVKFKNHFKRGLPSLKWFLNFTSDKIIVNSVRVFDYYSHMVHYLPNLKISESKL